VRGKYHNVILPMTVLRRLDAVLERTKQALLDMTASLDSVPSPIRTAAAAGQDSTICMFMVRDLRSHATPAGCASTQP
jgi:type I restriction enzyme M protein